MNTFNMSTSKNISVTPSWITSERYMFCDSFATDIVKKPEHSIITRIQNLFRK